MTRKKGSSNASGKGSQQAIERYRTKTTRRGRQRIILIVAALSLTAIIISYAIIASLPPYPARTPSGSISVPLMGPARHYHAHLDIYLDGTHIVVPGNIGNLPGNQFYALHTHDDDPGVIHIEPPVASQTFTLRQLFEVWGYLPFDNNHIFDKTGPVTLHVNGVLTQIDTYRLNCPDEIVLVYGTPPATIPDSYNFAPGSCS